MISSRTRNTVCIRRNELRNQWTAAAQCEFKLIKLVARSATVKQFERNV